MSKKFYITTPIYYPSASPHLGHAYCTTLCDIIARGKRMRGFDTYFLTGLDEHGEKIQENAEAKGVTPQAFVDEVAVKFTSLWNTMGISNDDFIRTTQPRHYETVKKIFSSFKTMMLTLAPIKAGIASTKNHIGPKPRLAQNISAQNVAAQ